MTSGVSLLLVHEMQNAIMCGMYTIKYISHLYWTFPDKDQEVFET